MKKLFNLLLMAVIITAFVGLGFADVKCQHEKSEEHHHGEVEMFHNLAKLNLTDSQKEKIHKLMQICLNIQKETQKKTTKLHEEIHQLVAAKKSDIKLIYDKIEEGGKLAIEMKKKCIGQKLKIKELLTPEQLKQWTELMAKEGCAHPHSHHGHEEKDHKHDEKHHHEK
jgi:Spy/CpxP family protein refolding chaperone